ncbi:HHR242Wp [Eremothecium sinecaudum]|uniref:HHR242Wp n=1 Tax=Eremothecium sinecaudum TaxID=45286 RepID=A0A109UYR0_9SACH|nr:HHR242Wp [Eremothecium sinecaudum]AMD23011.1 HHR242Wp [Eremothecium sinecaudum]
MDYSLRLEIPFETENQASIAVKALSPDPILKPEDFHVRFSHNNNKLLVSFQSVDNRVLRVGVSSVIDSIKTIIETFDEFPAH